MRYGDQYEFCQLDGKVPDDVSTQAEKCIKKLGLFTGGVDVLWDAKQGKAYVLEVNSSPYLGGRTAEKYALAMRKYLEEKGAA